MTETTEMKPPMPAHDYARQWANDTLSGREDGSPFDWGERNLANSYLNLRRLFREATAHPGVTISAQGDDAAEAWNRLARAMGDQP